MKLETAILFYGLNGKLGVLVHPVGFAVRRRTCPVRNRCVGLAEEVTYCKTLPCATWTEWGPWSSCVGTCDTGHQYRIRKCVGVGSCPGLEQEHRLCNNLPPCCQQWSQWSPCSVSCGRGVRTRVRTCMRKNDISNPAHLKEISLCEFPQCTNWDPCIPSVVIFCAQLFSAFSVLIYADIGCVEEEANHIVVDEKPDETLTSDAPHICIATCMKATSLPCRVAVFVRKTESSNGTCELYSKSANQIKTQAQNFNVDGGSASVFKLLNHCPSVDKNMSAVARANGGQKVVNVEGRTGYGASVQMYNTGWGPWSEWSSCNHDRVNAAKQLGEHGVRGALVPQHAVREQWFVSVNVKLPLVAQVHIKKPGFAISVLAQRGHLGTNGAVVRPLVARACKNDTAYALARASATVQQEINNAAQNCHPAAPSGLHGARVPLPVVLENKHAQDNAARPQMHTTRNWLKPVPAIFDHVHTGYPGPVGPRVQ
ncbi:Brain-specific angiogenesis inhibitor 1 [Trichinella pseudospiralis]|uniref:Brain-specific angiogenesis inhibitor 1 n=1 Tax=Trichinella pseudospiralis TaxID=6337 RepID=A0A0V0XFS5_TRIPS|nr:Brain-specific angiogenesis inhibitor 1 [Trichinella pseudospiralis]